MKKSLVKGLIALGLAAMLTGCGSSGKTIIDEVQYNRDGSMISEAEKYMESKDLMYENKYGIRNTIADDFLGYRAYYDIDGDDYLILLTFDSEDELSKASKDVKNYFGKMKDKKYDDSELSRCVNDNPRGWQDVFYNNSGQVYVTEYKENKDDTFDFKAAMYCIKGDLKEIQEKYSYIFGDINSYIYIALNGADGMTIEDFKLMQNPNGAPSGPETDSAASVETSSAAATEDERIVESFDSAVLEEQVATEPQSTVNAYEMLSECINKWNDIERNAFKYSYGYIGDIPAVFAIEPEASYRVNLLYVADGKVMSRDIGTWKDEMWRYKDCVVYYNPKTNEIVFEEVGMYSDVFCEIKILSDGNVELIDGYSEDNEGNVVKISGLEMLSPDTPSWDGSYSPWYEYRYEAEGSGSSDDIWKICETGYSIDAICLGVFYGPTDFMAIKLFDTFDEAYNANADGCSTGFLINEPGATAPG